MINREDVTVILPFKNSAEYLGETLDSIGSQSHKGWVVRLVDDGSTDGSVEIVNKFASGHPEKVFVEAAVGSGAACARNQAVSQASTRYIAYLDSDDVWEPRKLELQIDALQSSGAAFSYTAYRKIDQRSVLGDRIFQVPEVMTYRRLLAGNPIRCSTVIYDQYKLGRLFMPDIRMRNDWLTWLGMFAQLEDGAKRGEKLPNAVESIEAAPLAVINIPLCRYRQHRASLTGNKMRAVRYQWRAYRQYLGMSTVEAAPYFIRYALGGLTNYLSR